MKEVQKAKLSSWIKAMNMRGMFGRQNQSDKVIIEVSTVEEWARAVESEFGMHVTRVCPNNDDPPDCLATVNDRQISIELAELVDNNRIKKSVNAIKVGASPPHFHGTGFEKTQ